MNITLLGEPKYFEKRWKTKKGGEKSCYVLRWRLAGVRPNIREKGGFRIKEDARRYYHDLVVPAVNAGFPTPEEYEAALEEAKKSQDESRQKVGEFFDAIIDRKPPHIKQKSHKNNVAVYRLAICQNSPIGWV